MDALTNWDGIEPNIHCYNAVLSTIRIVADDVEEPIELEEAKTYLLVTYSDRDQQINNLIKTCRKALEDHKEVSIVTNTITAILNNGIGGIQLPYGPVTEVTEMKDFDENILTSDQYILKDYSITHPRYNFLTVTYTAGYTEDNPVPLTIKHELLELIGWVFFNKGTISEGLKRISAYHSRKTWLV